MAKKNKDEVPAASSVANRDIIQRLNFLYQASLYLNSVPSPQPQSPLDVSSTLPSSSTSPNAPVPGQHKSQKSGKNEKRGKNAAKRTVTASDLARNYITTMKSVGQKTTVKIDPAVKRTLCKGCNTTLIPGATASVRVKHSPVHGHIMVYTCTSCHTSRRIPAPPSFSAALVGNAQQEIASTAVSASASPPDAPITCVGQAPIGIEPTPSIEAAPAIKGGRGKRKTVHPRLPPLFARDVGHVVFRGNEQLVDEGRGNGLYVT